MRRSILIPLFALLLLIGISTAVGQSRSEPYPEKPTISLDLAQITNAAVLPPLTAEERTQLAGELRVTLNQPESQPTILLDRIVAQDQPLWISAAEVELYTNLVIQSVQSEVIEQQLTPLLGQQLIEQISESSDPIDKARLTVAGRLLTENFPIDTDVADLVQSELDLISFGDRFESPIAGRVIDYGPILTAIPGYEQSVTWLFVQSADGSEPHFPPHNTLPLHPPESAFSVELGGWAPADPTLEIGLEPDLETYDRLITEVDQFRIALGEAGVLSQPHETTLFELATLLAELEAIAIRIDGSRPLLESDRALLSGYPSVWQGVELPAGLAARPRVTVVLLEGKQLAAVGISIVIGE